MQPSVQLITVGVADVRRSRDFYSTGLGWTPTLDLPEIVFYQVGPGLLFAVFGLDDLAADAGAPVSPGGAFSLGQVVATTEAVDEATARARAAGAVILKEPQRASFGGYHAYFADPDGHRWEVAWNPGHTIAPDGTVRIAPIRGVTSTAPPDQSSALPTRSKPTDSDLLHEPLRPRMP